MRQKNYVKGLMSTVVGIEIVFALRNMTTQFSQTQQSGLISRQRNLTFNQLKKQSESNTCVTNALHICLNSAPNPISERARPHLLQLKQYVLAHIHKPLSVYSI